MIAPVLACSALKLLVMTRNYRRVRIDRHDAAARAELRSIVVVDTIEQEIVVAITRCVYGGLIAIVRLISSQRGAPARVQVSGRSVVVLLSTSVLGWLFRFRWAQFLRH